MAIRIRKVNGTTIAICAARSIHKEGDIYLDDPTHHALTHKFGTDFREEGWANFPIDDKLDSLVDVEESNNSGREWWDSIYDNPSY